jgi:RNA polymerase sigma factor (sigma-70 family)
MLSTMPPLELRADGARRAALARVRPQRRFTSVQAIDEAYELRLLGEVARWNDESAFEQIYARHRAAVAHVAMLVCRDAGTVEEIVQHTFTALWVRAGRLLDKSVRLRPWLTTVARNAAIDRLRAERSTGSMSDVPDPASAEPSPEGAALGAEAKAALAQAIALLSNEQRAAIELIYLREMTYQAAADALCEPIGTIKSRVRLALGHLRTRLAPGAA